MKRAFKMKIRNIFYLFQRVFNEANNTNFFEDDSPILKVH